MVKKLRKIQNATITGRRILIRCDLDVVKKGKISDDFRLVEALKTIQYIINKKPRQIIIMGHNGKPKAQEKDLSLKPVARWFEKKLKKKVSLVAHPYPESLPKKDRMILLENLRFSPQEKENDRNLVQQLTSFADIYVNNAFASSHRSHASIVGVPKHIKGYAGLTLQNEVKMLTSITTSPPNPFVSIVGFAKIHDKVQIMEKILKKADTVLVGGAVVFTFLKAQGFEVGKSLVDEQSLPLAKKMLKDWKKKIILPADIVVKTPKTIKTVDAHNIPKQSRGMDVGPASVSLFLDYLQNAKLVFWNGPLGKFEEKPFDKATNQLASGFTTQKVIVGGGDTAAAIRASGYADLMTHISTGGGASLEFIAKGTLPGIKSITR